MNTYPTVIFGIKGDIPQQSAGYARVSTKAQIIDDKTSIISQLEEIDQFILNNNLSPIDVQLRVKEVNRGNYNIRLEKFLNTHTNLTLFVYDATRFVRSKFRGNMYLDIALANNITIIFIYNNIIWNPTPFAKRKSYNDTRADLLKLFEYAENEPKLISMRLSQKNKYCRENFLTGTGRIPYGYKTIEEFDRELNTKVKRVVPHEYQMCIIRFIKYARTIGSDLYDFNETLRKLVEQYNYYRSEKYQDQPFDTYQFYDEYNEPLNIIADPLSYRDIATILNQNGILYKNNKVSKWTTQLVRSIAKFVPYNERIPSTRSDDDKLMHQLDNLRITPVSQVTLNKSQATKTAPTNLKRTMFTDEQSHYELRPRKQLKFMN